MTAMQGIGTPPRKPFTWSFSKLKNFETCGVKHNEVDNLKNWSEPKEPGGPLDWGDRVHAALAAACQGKAALPVEMVDYQIWVDRVLAGPGQLLVEQKYAIKRDFQPCPYFGKAVWMRGIADVVRIDGPVALALDWKTGAIKADSVQLGLVAQCIFSHFPGVQRVRSEFVWLAEACTTPEVFTRQELADMWNNGLLDRVAQLEQAYNSNYYSMKPSGLCVKWCPVKSCQFHGKGNLRK